MKNQIDLYIRILIKTLDDGEDFFLLPYLALTLVCRSMAWLGMITFIYMDTQDHTLYSVWIHFVPTSLYPRREKTIWSELESNAGPLTSQVTALTTRPWLLGQMMLMIDILEQVLDIIRSWSGL